MTRDRGARPNRSKDRNKTAPKQQLTKQKIIHMVPVLIVILADLFLLNLIFFGISAGFGWITCDLFMFLLWNICYALGVLVYKPYAQLRTTRVEQIAMRTAQTTLLMQAAFFLLMLAMRRGGIIYWHVLAVAATTYIAMFIGRFSARNFIKSKRCSGRNSSRVVFVGAGHNLAYLYQCMGVDPSTGYRIMGYFEDQPSRHLPEELPRLGAISQVIDWLEKHHVDQLYCNLPSSRSEEIVQIINYCDNHFIRFYSVPNVRNYVHRAMQVDFVDEMPVLTLRKEPLSYAYNRFIKRLFDIVVSGTFIVFFFWWIYIIVAIITKITMPGPVLFKQKRNGLLGDEFTCLKFRSMKVNADADRLQATKDDPRKTKWGNIMRKTSIDELPQFLNVLKGDMSIVGPRPHMVKHTEEYSELINKYMVRHWVKPGITGWAQVMGARGETHELWQMEDRIKKDIWYIENWSLWLDIRIMIKTVTNALGGDKQAY